MFIGFPKKWIVIFRHFPDHPRTKNQARNFDHSRKLWYFGSVLLIGLMSMFICKNQSTAGIPSITMRYPQCGAPPLVSWFVTVYHITIYWYVQSQTNVTNKLGQQNPLFSGYINRYFSWIVKPPWVKSSWFYPWTEFRRRSAPKVRLRPRGPAHMKNVFRKSSRMTYLESNDFWVVSEWFYLWYNGITIYNHGITMV